MAHNFRVETLDHLPSDAPEDGELRLFGGLLVRLVDADVPADPSARWRLAGCTEVAIGRSSHGTAPVRAGALAIGIDDRYASSRHAVLTREGRGWVIRDEGSKNGTFVDGRRLGRGERPLLGEEALLEIGHTFFLFRATARGPTRTPALVAPAKGAEPLTLNPEWELELDNVDRLAPTQHALLIEGESGVGKEVLARRLHRLSGRAGPLVALNCAALPENLLDDELFGHVRGAFSGAQGDRHGLIRAAHRGTLFLDEIGEMPPALQAKLLRVLEDHKVRPIGAERETSVDVRVIAATNRDLPRLVAEGTFRADLLARVGLASIRVPPVRRRREDLGLLLRAVLHAVPGGVERVRFEMEALRRLLLHPWPLNVRELRQALVVAVDLARGEEPSPVVITCHHLPQSVRECAATTELKQPASQEPRGRAARPPSPTDERQRAELVGLIERHSGNVAAVARELGRPRTNVQRLMARLDIDRSSKPGGASRGSEANRNA